MKRYLAAGALALAFGAGLALAQQIASFTLTGNEVIVAAVGGPGGPSIFVPVAELRNATGYQITGATPSGTFTPTNTVNTILAIGQPAASTVFTTPTSPYDGQLFQVCNTTAAAWAANTTTLVAASGQSISGGTITLTTLGAHTCAEVAYVLSSATWYQIR